MQFVNALSLPPAANNWLAISRYPRILHVFDHACNLTNERREVLSIVTPQIGNGPFNLVVEEDVLFSSLLNIHSPIYIRADQLHIEDLAISTINAKFWSPCPDWESLHARRETISDRLMNYLKPSDFDISLDNHSGLLNQRDLPVPQSSVSNLSSALVAANIPSAVTLTSQLAGLGQGLTPAGDDYIMGAIYAAWIIHPPEIASILAQEIAGAASPLTTSLSAAWLRSAGKGDAGILWHKLFNALISDGAIHVEEAMDNILGVGETSGADALAGFIGTFYNWVDLQENKTP